jgi:hypothetical protein
VNTADHLERLLPYRLDAVAILELMLRFRLQWEEPKRMQIFVEDRLQFQGSTSMFLNPILEVGVLHIRALLEFLGVKERAGRLVSVSERRSDDSAIELLRHNGFTLSPVSPEQACASHAADPVYAEQCYVAAITAANKGLAHLTVDYPQNPADARQILLASQLTQRLVEKFVYEPLGAQRPPLPIQARARTS